MKKTFGIALVAVLAGLVAWQLLGDRGGALSYRFVSVERGDVEYTVSSTGTLDATTTVQIGTQVSGQIAEIRVDFNDRVEQGELMARIDPTLLKQEVRSGEANLQRAQAEQGQRQLEHGRAQELFADQVVSQSELDVAAYSLALADASLQSARVGLDRARQNLAYTDIHSPIDGVVVERNVDVGQTVAASLQAPQLFLIAEDLSQMEILVSVDESDIGLICEGQTARFTVQAYPDETFTGVVRQVRLQSSVQENVVNYTVVVDVINDTGRLLPGMTATVDFVIDSSVDVFKVQNTALRFRATEEMMAELGERRAMERGVQSSEEGPAAREAPKGMPGSSARREGATLLWHLDADGRLSATSVEAGLSDGRYTAIAGPGIEAGLQVIAGVTQASSNEASNPFQSSQESAQRPPRPPMM